MKKEELINTNRPKATYHQIKEKNTGLYVMLCHFDLKEDINSTNSNLSLSNKP